MTRHGKNCTASSVYSYHERKKDSSTSGYGSKELRLGKDSVKEFDCCCLTLQPCENPVLTPEGYLFDKEAILKYILHQKREIARKLKEFEKQKVEQEKEALQEDRVAHATRVKKFMEKQSIKSKDEDPQEGSSKGSISNMVTANAKQLPSFWVPSLTPQAKKTLVKKPEEKVRCPMSGKPLKMKDLFDIKFTEIKDGSKKSLITKDARYVCAVTNDVLGNSVPCVVLKTSGNVVTTECYEKIIKQDMIDPTNGKKLTEKDVIPLQRGASGFSAAGVTLNAKKDGAALQC